MALAVSRTVCPVRSKSSSWKDQWIPHIWKFEKNYAKNVQRDSHNCSIDNALVQFFLYIIHCLLRCWSTIAHIKTRLAKAAAFFRRLDNVWRSSTFSLKIKLDHSTPPSLSLHPYMPLKPGRVQLEYVNSWTFSSSTIYGRFWVLHGKTSWLIWRCWAELGSEDYRTLQQRDDFGWQAILSGCHLDDQPIKPCHGPLVVVAIHLNWNETFSAGQDINHMIQKSWFKSFTVILIYDFDLNPVWLILIQNWETHKSNHKSHPLSVSLRSWWCAFTIDVTQYLAVKASKWSWLKQNEHYNDNPLTS